MNIQELLNSTTGQQMVDGVANQLGIEKGKAKSVVDTAVPLLFTALNKNAAEGDAPNIMKALSKHDGSILNNVNGFLGAGDFSDGMGILGHLLGNKQSGVENALEKSSGLSGAQITQVLAMLAPLVMGYLGKEKKSGGLDAGSLTSVLGNLIGGEKKSGNKDMGMLEQLLGGESSSGGGLMDIGGKILGGLLGGKK